MEQQEILMQLSYLQQQAEGIEQKINMVNQQIVEIEGLKEGLNKIAEAKNKAILANIGKGVYVEAELKSEKILVNIGNNIVVKKTAKETGEIIDKQIEQLSEVKTYLLSQLEEVNMQLQQLVTIAREGRGQED